MKIYIYPYDNSIPQNCYDITPYIQNVDTQKRSDDAFAITTFKAIIPNDLFSLVKYNIQPFTIFEIAPNGETQGNSNNTRYFGYSKCSKYLRTQNNNKTYYVHDITLIEPLAILEAIQIGTKTFSYHKDTYYLNIIKELIRVQYGITIFWVFENNWENTEMHNFSFDKGSTAFSICNEILRVNNFKMVAKFETPYGSDPYDIKIVITPFDVSNIQTVSINENKLTLVEYNQDFNNYCYNLESQIDNVVDRNSTTLWHNLTPRSDEPTATADNCFIELPELVESIEELKVKLHFEEEIYFRVSEDELTALEALGTSWSWDDLLSVAPWLNGFYHEIKQEYPYFNASAYTYHTTAGLTSYNIVATVENAYKWLDLSPRCVEQSIYQSIPAINQPEYCFYRSGSNRIEGIYKFYQDDWIHQLIGQTNTPMLENIDKLYNFEMESTHPISTTQNGAVSYVMYVSSTDANPLLALFSVRAHAISSQYVKDVKAGTPMNASSYFNVSRSYGNSANYIDYDIMRKNIKIANKSLGTPELTLQFLNECNLTANSKFTYDSQTWYVTSIIMQIFRNRITYTVNASTDYNKQASCIGVRTQFETTKIALNNIKQRHLYYRLDDSINFNKDTMYYLDIEFAFATEEESREYLLPLTIYDSEDGLTLVHNFVDNYSCGTYLTNESGGKFIQKDASYVDDFGEAEYFSKFKIITYNGNDLNDELSRKLPLKPNNSLYLEEVIKDLGRKLIYKDNHEALAITIFMPNARLIESN